MTGIFLFPAKPEKGYKYKSKPKEVLELTDEDVLSFSRGNHQSYEFFHYTEELDKLDDKEAIGYFNKWSNGINLDNVKKSGKGYATEDKQWIVRILRCDRDWFKARRY